jgi:23S rRNA (uracil1939-C5)-methyltransferase
LARKRKEIIEELLVESIGFNGVSVARKDEMVHFVKGGVPGDLLETVRLRKRKKHIENHLLRIITPSKNRIDAPCKYFNECGGCSWQNMPYSYQLEWKKKHVEDAFFRQNKFEEFKILDTLASPKEFNYRNKMEFSFSNQRWLSKEEINSGDESITRDFALGLHAPGRFDKVLNLDKCLIADETSEEVLQIVRNLALELKITCLDRKINEGFLRNLIIRSGEYGNTLLVILITNKLDEENQIKFIEQLREKLATITKITGFIHCINSTPSPVKIEEQKLLFGEENIYQSILGINYRISPFSFFQTNSFQLDNFISKIIEIANLSKNDVIWDLYCGTGSITLPASHKVKKVIGVELVESSIIDAKENAKINKINNSEFYTSDLHDKNIPDLLNNFEKPDKVIIDPPRAGMHANLINHLIELKPKEIIYVSCNPMTQARDCDLLRDYYNIELSQPVDMFPHTYHIENIVLMKLKD